MKKILLLALSAIFGMSAYAADPVQFVDAEGNDVTGKTIERVVISEEDIWTGGVTSVAYAHLSLKNVSSETVYVKVLSNVTEMANGLHQQCFNQVCTTDEAPGMNMAESLKPQTLAVGKEKDLQAEWFPAADAKSGQCVVTYITELYEMYIEDPNLPIPSFDKIGEGPSVTVVYTFNPTGGVADLEADKEVASVSYYNICGRQVANPENGLYIKRIVYTDGSVKTEKLHIN